MLVPGVQSTLFDGPLVFRCVLSVKPGLLSRDAGSAWHPARTRVHQQVGPVRGYRLQGTVSHLEGSLLGAGPVDRRALSCAIHTMTGPIFVVDESCSLMFWLRVTLS